MCFTTFVNNTPVRSYEDLSVAIAEVRAGIKWQPGSQANTVIRRTEEFYSPTCEHGLSEDLCYGPMHYPPDNHY